MSYQNFLLYGAVIPSFNKDKDKEDNKYGEVIDTTDPKNADRVKRIFDNMN